MLRSRIFGSALFFAIVLGFSGAAQATSFSLGPISGPGSFSIGNTKDPGPFEDRVHFTIDPGVTLLVNAKAFNQSGRHDGIYDLDGTLNDSSSVLLEGDSQTLPGLGGQPYPYQLVTFASIVLGPGSYYFSIFGTEDSDVGISSDWAGTVTFSQTPLPPALILMLTALGGMGLFGRSRSRKST